MIKPAFKKTLFVFIGLLSALIFLELSMRAAGFALSEYQKYSNYKTLKNKSRYTVMCIGESTTDRQYPIPLQNILNKKYPNKFSIIDCGKSGPNFTAISDSLDDNISRYRPDIAVCMMGGVNVIGQIDESPLNSAKFSFLKNIRLYKLYVYVKNYFKSLKYVQESFADDIKITDTIEQMLPQIDTLYMKGDYKTVVHILKSFLKKDPNNKTAFAYLTEVYFYNLPEFKDTGYEMALQALKSGKGFERAPLYQKVIVYNKEKNDIPLVKRFIAELMNEKNIKIDMILYGTIKNFLTPEQKEKILKKLSKEKNDVFYGVMAIENMELGNFEKAEEFFNTAEEFRIDFPNERKNILYRAIIKKLIASNIKVVCMQYPVRNVKPLQNILKNEPYYGKITFVSNESNFKRALREKKYHEIFRDQYGGDFGHCTDYGNALIAENLAKTLAKITGEND